MKLGKVDKKKPGGGMAVPANNSLFCDRPECGDSWRQIAACQAAWLEPCPHSPPAWREGPAVAPNNKFQTGWGRNLSWEAPQIQAGDEGAISSTNIVEPKLQRLSVQYRSSRHKNSPSLRPVPGHWQRQIRGFPRCLMRQLW